MCPVTVTAPVTPDLRWNRADAPKHEQVSLFWEIWSCLLEFELWIFQTVDSHSAKISL